MGVALVMGYREKLANYPKPRFLPTESNYTYTRGDTATLHCNVANLGTKTVTWRRVSAVNPLTIGEMTFTEDTDYQARHIPYGSTNWNLLIKNVQPRHAGGYECQISTGDKMKKTVYLKVLDNGYRKPNITITGTFHVDKGETIRLRCNATGAATPPDAVDWFKDGIKLHSDSKRPIQITKQFTISKKTITSELSIRHANMKDTGTYTCRTSDLQVTSENINVLNAEKPKPDKQHKKRDEIFQETKLGGHQNGRSGSQQVHSSLPQMLMIVLVLTFSLLTNNNR